MVLPFRRHHTNSNGGAGSGQPISSRTGAGTIGVVGGGPSSSSARYLSALTRSPPISPQQTYFAKTTSFSMGPPRLPSLRLPLWLLVVTISVVFLIVVGFVGFYVTYRRTEVTLDDVAKSYRQLACTTVENEIVNVMASMVNVVSALGQFVESSEMSADNPAPIDIRKALTIGLAASRRATAVYIGMDTGQMLGLDRDLVHANGPPIWSMANNFTANGTDHFHFAYATWQGWQEQTWQRTLSSLIITDKSYNATLRGWFSAAASSATIGSVLFPKPYASFTGNEIVLSQPLVIGVPRTTLDSKTNTSATWGVTPDPPHVSFVAATEMPLSYLDTFIQSVIRDLFPQTLAFLVEIDTGYLLASSVAGEHMFQMVDLVSGEVTRVQAVDAHDPTLRALARGLVERGGLLGWRQYYRLCANVTTMNGSNGQSVEDVVVTAGNYYLNVRRVKLTGIDWLLVVGTEKEEWMAKITSGIPVMVGIVAAAVGGSCLLIIIAVRLLTSPLRRLIDDITILSEMDFDNLRQLPSSWLHEIALLVHALNLLTRRMREYRTFLPEQLFARPDVDEEGADEGGQAGGVVFGAYSPGGGGVRRPARVDERSGHGSDPPYRPSSRLSPPYPSENDARRTSRKSGGTIPGQGSYPLPGTVPGESSGASSSGGGGGHLGVNEGAKLSATGSHVYRGDTTFSIQRMGLTSDSEAIRKSSVDFQRSLLGKTSGGPQTTYVLASGESTSNLDGAGATAAVTPPNGIMGTLPSTECRMAVVACIDLADFSASFPKGFDEVCTLHVEYLSVVLDAVQSHAGTLDKIIGDRVFAVWNVPQRVARAEIKAVQCGLLIQSRFNHHHNFANAEASVDATPGSPGRVGDATTVSSPKPRVRIGIASSLVYFGVLGTSIVRMFAVIGDATGRAVLLQKLVCKILNVGLLITEDIYKQVECLIFCVPSLVLRLPSSMLLPCYQPLMEHDNSVQAAGLNAATSTSALTGGGGGEWMYSLERHREQTFQSILHDLFHRYCLDVKEMMAAARRLQTQNTLDEELTSPSTIGAMGKPPERSLTELSSASQSQKEISLAYASNPFVTTLRKTIERFPQGLDIPYMF